MPVLQQQSTTESISSADSTISSQNGSMRNISELLGLNIPRGTTLGQASQFAMSSRSLWSPPENSSNPLALSLGQGQGQQHGRFTPSFPDSSNNSLDSPLHAMPVLPLGFQYDLTQSLGPISPLRMPRAIRGSTPFSDCSSPSMEQALVQQLASRSISPSESDGSNASDLPDKMNNLSISPPGGICSPPTEQELANLRALHTITNNFSLPNVNPPVLPWLYTYPTPSLDNRQNPFNENIDVLDKVARFHRNQAASFFDATLTWRGVLPQRFLSDNPTFSCKVFLGGVPWDVTEDILVTVFSQFGNVQVEWPGKDTAPNQPKGCVYVIFESEKQVKALIKSCKREISHGNGENWYFRISSRKLKSKEVQVIPWCLSDSNFMEYSNHKLDPHCTVFVGALHGMLNAEGLFKIMNDLFGGVIYAGIDTDKFRYPIGSARVCFNSQQSYMSAVAAAFIEIKTVKFSKKVQVDPYLEDSPCSGCWVRQGPYFCREVTCFRYFCHSCWMLQHQYDFSLSHKPLTRGSKTHTAMPSKMRFTHQ